MNLKKKTWYKTSVLLGRTLESLFESKDQRVLKTKLSSERESVLGKTQKKNLQNWETGKVKNQ